MQKQLSAVCGAQTPATSCMTVAAGQVAPATGGTGQTQVLVTADDGPVAGYDTSSRTRTGLVAQRFGLKNGGRVVIRPDGYIGAVAALDDTTTVADYFAKIRS